MGRNSQVSLDPCSSIDARSIAENILDLHIQNAKTIDLQRSAVEIPDKSDLQVKRISGWLVYIHIHTLRTTCN